MTPDPELIGRLLLRVEADAHRNGWDQPAQVLAIYDWHDRETEHAYAEIMATRRGRPTRCGPYAAQSVVPSYALDGHPAHALFRFALNVRGGADLPPVSYVVGALRQPGFLGLAFQVEAWARTMASREERDALGNVRFADLPGSVEVRNVIATDIAGVDYYVSRERGKKPKSSRTGDGGDLQETEGAVVESLRVLVAVIAGHKVPEIENVPSQWDWDAETRGARS